MTLGSTRSSILFLLLLQSCTCFGSDRDRCNSGENNDWLCAEQPALPRSRIVLIANTDFEADGLLSILNDARTRPRGLVPPVFPAPEDGARGLRARYACSWVDIEVLCIYDAVRLTHKDHKTVDQTSYKLEVLPSMIGCSPDLVIAFGTAAYPDRWESHNGSVYAGSAVLVHSREVSADQDPALD